MDLEHVVYVVDENLVRLGNGMTALRRDTATFTKPPVHELLHAGILDPEWIPIVGERGWVVITSDKRLRTRPNEAQLAATHRLKAVHLHGDICGQPAWEQLVRIAAHWDAIEDQAVKPGPWWLSLRKGSAVVRPYEPGNTS